MRPACPKCGESLRKAAIELSWEVSQANASGAAIRYEHMDGAACTVEYATSEAIDNILGELRNVPGLDLRELRPYGEASRLAHERWARWISN